MPITRTFRDTVLARAQRDARFRSAMLTEAINALLSGDLDTGKAMLRDYVNATVTFDVTSTNGAPASSIVWPLGGCPPTSGASPFIARCTITLPTGTSGTEISVTTRF